MLNKNPLRETIPAGDNRRASSWDIANAAKNYLSLVLAQGGSAIFAFASVWLITRTLGSEGYGSIVAVIAASQIAQVLVNWTGTAVVRYGVDEFVETEKIARIFWARLLILIPNALLVLLTSRFWFPTLADWLKLSPEILWLIFLHFAGTIFWLHIQFSLQAVKMPRLQGWLLMAERSLIFAGLLALFLSAKLDPSWALICYSAAPVLMAITGFWFLRKFIFVSFSVDRQFWQKILIFSLPLLPFTLTSYLSGGYVDAVFISRFLSTRDLGLYSVATQINGIALQLPTLANILLLPLFISLKNEGDIGRLQRYFRHIFPSLTLMWGFFTTVLALFCYFLIPAVFGPEFSVSTQPVWILMGTTVLVLPPLIGYGALSNATSTTYISMWSAIVAALVNVFFNVLLIPIWGLQGCAWATAIMYLLSSLAWIGLVRRVEKVPFSWTHWAVIPSIAGAACISLTTNPWISFAVCITLTFSVAYLCKTSLMETVFFLVNFRKGNPGKA